VELFHAVEIQSEFKQCAFYMGCESICIRRAGEVSLRIEKYHLLTCYWRLTKMKFSLAQLNRPRCIAVGVISATPARSFTVLYKAL